MKVLSLSLYTFPTPTTSTLLSTASDLSAYSFLTKGSVQEGLNFLSSTVASRTLDGQRQSVQEGQNSASVYRKGSVAGECSPSYYSLSRPQYSHPSPKHTERGVPHCLQYYKQGNT